MTEGPPPSAASSSGTSGPSSTPKIAPSQGNPINPALVAETSVPSASIYPVPGAQTQPYSNWANAWPPNYSGYATMASNTGGQSNGTYYYSNPYTASYGTRTIPQQSKGYNPYSQLTGIHLGAPKPIKSNGDMHSKHIPPPPRIPTPPLPDPETYKHWDEELKSFFVATGMVQTLRGLESDILLLNPEWEQKVLPEAIKELIGSLQLILDRMSATRKQVGDEMQIDKTVDITTKPQMEPEEKRSLEDRKLDYIQLANGKEPRSQSSINKSISQFLARTRARNDASNRAEFLHTLAEKKRQQFAEAHQGSGMDMAVDQKELTSCARVDAKPIDRDKQMKYDIAKNEHRPLTRNASSKQDGPAPSASVSTAVSQLAQSSSSMAPPAPPLATPLQPRKKRRLATIVEDDADEGQPGTATRRSKRKKGKAKEKSPSMVSPSTQGPPENLEEEEEEEEAPFAPERLPGLDERIRNIEDHLAVRYVPSIPRTLLARLKYLEDHLVKLEKEYPPWAALHFNQPNRGWPPPPRATPVIVPASLRSSHSTNPATSTGPMGPLATSSSATSLLPTQNGGTASVAQMPGTKQKGRKSSSLHKAVLDRLEVQKAMDEIGAAGT